MKKILLLSVIFMSFTAFGQNKKAAAYNNKLVKYQHVITPKSDKLFDALQSMNMEKMKAAEQDLIKALDKSITKMKAFADFEGDAKLRDEFVAWAQHYKELVEKEYGHMRDILAAKPTEENKKKLNELMETIRKEEHEFDMKLEQAQKDFSSRHGLKLE